MPSINFRIVSAEPQWVYALFLLRPIARMLTESADLGPDSTDGTAECHRAVHPRPAEGQRRLGLRRCDAHEEQLQVPRGGRDFHS